MDKKYIDLIIINKNISSGAEGEESGEILEMLETLRAPANSGLVEGDSICIQNNVLKYKVVSVIPNVEVSVVALEAIPIVTDKVIFFEYPETESNIDLVTVSFTYIGEDDKEETVKRVYRAPANSGITTGSIVESIGMKYNVLSVDTISANSSLCASIEKVQTILSPFEYETPEVPQQALLAEDNLIIPNQANLGINEDQQVMPDQDNLLPPEELEDEIDTSSVQKAAEENLK